MSPAISIVIVNYNVQFFLEQCLNSIFNVSDFQLGCEVIVIDNNSTDHSKRLVKAQFPEVILIENTKNVGFSKANNQGIKISKGDFILLLNPDTLISENTLSTCYEKMQSNDSIGAIGVRMVDGRGDFLPESKRGFPTPMSSFYRFSGIYKLFPKSANFNHYYQGHIEEYEAAEIDILCGAFMFIRRETLNRVGLLDEAFFMYGEDIDLSYRIRQGGSKILYLPETTIVHFKGESTKKDSVAYTKRFYNAMDIFAKKHFKDSKASSFLRYLSFVIWIKAFLDFIRKSVAKLLIPIFDIAIIFFGLKTISLLWASYYYQDAGYYENAPLNVNFLLYTMIWFFSILYGGGYDQEMKPLKLIRNLGIGTLVILAVYGLLDVEYRSSRAIIIISAIFLVIVLPLSRWIWEKMGLFTFKNLSKSKRLLVLANEEDYSRIEGVLSSSQQELQFLQRLPANVSTYELNEIITVEKVNEVICNVKDVGMGRIIEMMSLLGSKIAFKITGDESLGIIGSQSKNKSGEIYTLKINYDLQNPDSKRNKRTFDLVIALLSLLLLPITLFNKAWRKIILGIPDILLGRKTIIGYQAQSNLPFVKDAIYTLSGSDAVDYAKNYSVWKDLRSLWKSIT